MKIYTEKQIMVKFNELSSEHQNKILHKALKLALDNRAGTKEYAIANSMGYRYEDNGSYTK